MILRVEPSSPVPPYEQIRGQIVTMVSSGVLRPGSRLPAIRQLAIDLGVAAATVARAYRELESAGAVRSSRGRGTFIAEALGGTPATRRHEELREAADDFARRAYQLGIAPERALTFVSRALNDSSAG